jgi:hypothetical protein
VSLVDRLVERHRHEKDETVLVGLFDLLLRHKDRAQFAGALGGFLDRTTSLDLYRFLVNSIVARRDPALITVLRRPNGPDKDSRKGKVLEEALALAPG